MAPFKHLSPDQLLTEGPPSTVRVLTLEISETFDYIFQTKTYSWEAARQSFHDNLQSSTCAYDLLRATQHLEVLIYSP